VLTDRQMMKLSRDECLCLLGSVSLGRIIFTSGALPAIRPVHHLLLAGHIVIRAGLGAAIGREASGAGTVVAYEADVIGADQQLAWSVVVIGRARRVAGSAAESRYREALGPSPGQELNQLITISTDLVTGHRVMAEPAVSDPQISPA
jgi:hypothetical protein